MKRSDLRSAVTHLRSGGLLIYPTETAYAVGCDATNAKAVRAIFRLKGREHGKPLPLIMASRAMAERYARFTPNTRQLARRHWPGALTLVLSVRRPCAPGVAASDGSYAMRVSSHPIARALSRMLGRPIVSTSANRSGQPPCYSVRSALRSLDVTRKKRPRFSGQDMGVAALDVGSLPRRRPSTIVDARGDRIVVLRRGTIRV